MINLFNHLSDSLLTLRLIPATMGESFIIIEKPVSIGQVQV